MRKYTRCWRERPSLSTDHAATSRTFRPPYTLLKAGKSYTQVAEETGVGKAHLSLPMNHFDRAKRGDRVLGEAALKGIQGKLNGGIVNAMPREQAAG